MPSDPQKGLTLRIPRFWTFSLQNGEVKFLLLKLPSLWNFVTTDLA